MQKKSIIAVIVLGIIVSSCFRGWFLSEKEITRHYQNISSKPVSHVIENDSVKLHFVTFGADSLTPVLFIHGAPGSWDGYLNLLDDTTLQQHFQLISVDRLGYGESQKKGFSSPYSIENQANAIILALSANCSQQKAILLGRSYGVPIAAKIAADFPEKVQKLILLSPAIDPDKEKFWWFSPFGKMFFVRWFLPEKVNTATDEKYAHIDELRKLVNDWHKIQSEVTVMQGGNDWIIDTTNFTFAKKMLITKNAKFIFIPEANHFISTTNPELVKAEILNTNFKK
jgi:pimeloyl-ACP methyl ester carboxylesterase